MGQKEVEGNNALEKKFKAAQSLSYEDTIQVRWS